MGRAPDQEGRQGGGHGISGCRAAKRSAVASPVRGTILHLTFRLILDWKGIQKGNPSAACADCKPTLPMRRFSGSAPNDRLPATTERPLWKPSHFSLSESTGAAPVCQSPAAIQRSSRTARLGSALGQGLCAHLEVQLRPLVGEPLVVVLVQFDPQTRLVGRKDVPFRPRHRLLHYCEPEAF